VLTGDYTYYDVNQDAEGVAIFRWLRYNKDTKEYEPINNATDKSYTLTEADIGTTLKFEVTPVAVNEPKTGEPALSEALNGPAVPYVKNVSINSVGKMIRV